MTRPEALPPLPGSCLADRGRGFRAGHLATNRKRISTLAEELLVEGLGRRQPGRRPTGSFAWLVKPIKRLAKPIPPKAHAQPGFFFPFGQDPAAVVPDVALPRSSPPVIRCLSAPHAWSPTE